MSDEGGTVTEWEGVDVLGNLIDNQRCDMTQGRGTGRGGTIGLYITIVEGAGGTKRKLDRRVVEVEVV